MRQRALQWFSGSKLPVFLLSIFIVVFCALRFYWTGNVKSIASDARGYYAYLPALLTYNDPSFEASRTAEVQSIGHQHQEYLVTLDNGQRVNKYFPGPALFQAPFYGMAAAISAITGKPVDGYSYYFQLFFRIGSLFYALIALFLFFKFLRRLYPQNDVKIAWIFPLLLVATPLFHYCFNALSYSHCYSFGLFSLFGILALKAIDRPSKQVFFSLGLTLGLITIVRPTDLTILLIVPFLIGLKTKAGAYFRMLFTKHSTVFVHALLGFAIPIILMLLLWYWETGSFWKSSYGGEGFRFFAPHFAENLFSFRIGLFLHTPIALVAVSVALVHMFRHPQRWSWWMLYFLVNVWVISAWWCWDYESGFGNRPFSQHFVFLLLPLLPLLFKYFKAGYVLLAAFAFLGFIRLYTHSTGYMTNQRFTSESYFESMLFWRDDNFGRWQFTRSAEPYGKKIASAQLYRHPGMLPVHPNDSIPFDVTNPLSGQHTNERCYYRVSLDKMVETVPFDRVVLVFEVSNQKSGLVFEYPVKLYNDKFEGFHQWKHLVFEGLIVNNLHLYDTFRVFLRNSEGQRFMLRDIRIDVLTYKS